jgi:ribonuclease P protein component
VWVSWIPDEGEARVAFALGRGIGSAPVRNRARRQLRAALAARAERLPGGWYLVGATPAIAGSSFREIEVAIDDVVAALREAK